MDNNIHPTENIGRNPDKDKSVETPETENNQVVPKHSKFSPRTIIDNLKSMNRNTKLAVVLTSVLLLVGVVSFMMTRDKSSEIVTNESNIEEIEQADSMGIKVTLQEGTLEVNKDGEWKEVSTEETLKSGESLRTVGATSRSVITFDDGSELRLDANSEVEIETLTTSRIVIKHKAGYTYSRVVPSDSMKYVVSSTDAQYEALGTAFKTATTGDEQAVEVYQSSVIETSTNKTAKEGEKLTVKSEADPSKDGKVEKLDIEQVKNDAFMQWNRDLDLSSDKFKSTVGYLNDVTAPEITIATADGETVLLEPNATEGTIEISGTTEKGAKVTVQSKSQSGSTPVDVVVDAGGGFKTPVLAAPLGSATFEFIVKDKSGNTTTKNVRVTFQRKSQVTKTSGIDLTGAVLGNKVELGWTLNGTTTTPDGVKVVYSKSENPAFTNPATPGVTSKLETGNSTTISNLNSGTYYFKVCIFDSASGTCGLYSNQVTLVIP